ncbi:conserved hypothetical protein [Candidatus Roizmanbacteria bacterium]|nr:conserved hypothetical protein [Candidatus Roizmanbacteria bacterium]
MNKSEPKKLMTDEDIRQLVVARLRSFSSNKKISIGSDGEFTGKELIEKVKANDEIGQKIVNIQLEYLRSLKDNIFTE